MKNQNGTQNGWENCHMVIKCLWDNQETSSNWGEKIFFHRIPRAKKS